MKKICVLILALFAVTCDNPAEDVLGCTDTLACNYNTNANTDDGSCEFAEENFNCEGNCLNDTDSDGICDENENSSWVFVANEGNFGSSNGTISMIDDFGNVMQTEAIGDVVQSLEVYENKLIVLVNNSHMIKIYDITEDGLSMPGIEVSTDGSSPRDLVVINDKVYFTNWNSQDVKVLNLFNYNIETSIPVNGLPEDLIIDGNDLWVTINMNADWSSASTVVKIDMFSNTITETVEVGSGPQELTELNGDIFVSRTFYDENWNAAHGATKIGIEGVVISDYGAGASCGGSILKHQNTIYRSFDGGVSPLNADLSLDVENKIGDYDQSLVYHVEEINGNIWFALTSFTEDYNEIKVIDSFGTEINSYQAGKFPGDFAFWSMND